MEAVEVLPQSKFKVVHIQTESAEVTDDELEVLRHLTGVRSINIFFTPRLTNDGLRHLSQLSGLSVLGLQKNQHHRQGTGASPQPNQAFVAQLSRM